MPVLPGYPGRPKRRKSVEFCALVIYGWDEDMSEEWFYDLVGPLPSTMFDDPQSVPDLLVIGERTYVYKHTLFYDGLFPMWHEYSPYSETHQRNGRWYWGPGNYRVHRAERKVVRVGASETYEPFEKPAERSSPRTADWPDHEDRPAVVED